MTQSHDASTTSTGVENGIIDVQDDRPAQIDCVVRKLERPGTQLALLVILG